MSDRNLGLMPGILDIFQATLLSTAYNPTSIHFVPVETNDKDNSDALVKFAKWGLGNKNEANFFPECDDYIANKVAHGASFFKVVWDIIVIDFFWFFHGTVTDLPSTMDLGPADARSPFWDGGVSHRGVAWCAIPISGLFLSRALT